MTEYTVQVDDAVAQTIREFARRQKISETECAAQILVAHHETFMRFPDEVLREGREKLIELLSQIPCLSRFESSGVDSRYWWVQFDIDDTSPMASRVLKRLAYLLNTESSEMMLPTVFKPVPADPNAKGNRWEIASTAPRLDPADVECWLRENLPQLISSMAAWTQDD